jgi:chemotaxis protein MotB
MSDFNKEEGGEVRKLFSGVDGSVDRRYGRSRRSDRGRISSQRRNSNAWLLSFTDVMALLLTFFVLLFAMSTPRSAEWEDVTSALHKELNRFYGQAANRGLDDHDSIDRIKFGGALNVGYLKTIIENAAEENEMLRPLELTMQGNSLMLSLPQHLLFEDGGAEVRPEGADVLYALGDVLSRFKNSIEILGHADPRVIQEGGAIYGNNWELSLARSASVAGLLASVGYDRGVTIMGLSSGRYEDLESVSMTETERMKISRRVDILIRDHDGNIR